MRKAIFIVLALFFFPLHCLADDWHIVEIKPPESMLHLIAYGKDGDVMARGTALAIAPQKALTACHIFAGAYRGEAILAQKKYKIKILGSLPDYDLCLLAVEGAVMLAPVTQGQGVLENRAPLRFIGQPEPHYKISSKGPLLASLQIAGAPFYAVEAALPVGMSGGGLFDAAGHLWGLATHRAPWPDLSFALRLDMVMKEQFTPLVSPAEGPLLPFSYNAPPFTGAGNIWPDLVMLRLKQGVLPGHQEKLQEGWQMGRQDEVCFIRSIFPDAPSFLLHLAREKSFLSFGPVLRGEDELLRPLVLSVEGVDLTMLPVVMQRMAEGWQVHYRLEGPADFVRFFQSLPQTTQIKIMDKKRGVSVFHQDITPLIWWESIRDLCF